MTMSINLPKPSSDGRKDSSAESSKTTRRKSALKSARAAAKAQMKAEGVAANQDDIRVAKPPSTKADLDSPVGETS